MMSGRSLPAISVPNLRRQVGERVELEIQLGVQRGVPGLPGGVLVDAAVAARPAY